MCARGCADQCELPHPSIKKTPAAKTAGVFIVLDPQVELAQAFPRDEVHALDQLAQPCICGRIPLLQDPAETSQEQDEDALHAAGGGGGRLQGGRGAGIRHAARVETCMLSAFRPRTETACVSLPEVAFQAARQCPLLALCRPDRDGGQVIGCVDWHT